MVEMKSPTTATLWLNRDRVQSKDYIGPVKKLAHRQKKNLLTEVVKILLTIKIKFCLPYRLKSAYRTEKKVLTEIVKKVLDFYIYLPSPLRQVQLKQGRFMAAGCISPENM